jgi:hypothetical protein
LLARRATSATNSVAGTTTSAGRPACTQIQAEKATGTAQPPTLTAMPDPVRLSSGSTSGTSTRLPRKLPSNSSAAPTGDAPSASKAVRIASICTRAMSTPKTTHRIQERRLPMAFPSPRATVTAREERGQAM